jgi:hypothetical protein
MAKTKAEIAETRKLKRMAKQVAAQLAREEAAVAEQAAREARLANICTLAQLRTFNEIPYDGIWPADEGTLGEYVLREEVEALVKNLEKRIAEAQRLPFPDEIR